MIRKIILVLDKDKAQVPGQIHLHLIAKKQYLDRKKVSGKKINK